MNGVITLTIKNWECDTPIHYPLTLTTIGFTFPVLMVYQEIFKEVAKMGLQSSYDPSK